MQLDTLGDKIKLKVCVPPADTKGMDIFTELPPTSWHTVDTTGATLNDDQACALLSLGVLLSGFANAHLRAQTAAIQPSGTRPESRVLTP